jgi:hypothetical protein
MHYIYQKPTIAPKAIANCQKIYFRQKGQLETTNHLPFQAFLSTKFSFSMALE